jgi:hypothetical protein
MDKKVTHQVKIPAVVTVALYAMRSICHLNLDAYPIRSSVLSIFENKSIRC